MNLEIANRLVELRRRHGLSQEELADKLGVSRQAVSKWERVEAAPDTDNLIALAKLYDISIDELLDYSPKNKTDETVFSESKEEKEEADGYNYNDDKTKVHIGPDGIFVKDGDDIVDLSWKRGIHISSTDESKKGFHMGPKDWDKEKWKECQSQWKDEGHKKDKNGQIDSVIFLLSIIGYIVLGAMTGYWHPGWLIFFFTPILGVLFELKRFNGVFPIIVTGTFLSLGLILNLWHPGWVVFLLIPAYYIAVDIIKNAKGKDGK
jgi:transcriptional regulator with XRE-family HTH domain